MQSRLIRRVGEAAVAMSEAAIVMGEVEVLLNEVSDALDKDRLLHGDPAIAEVDQKTLLPDDFKSLPVEQMERIAELEHEVNSWKRAMGELANMVPLPEVIKVTGTIGDFSEWIISKVNRVTELEAALKPFADCAEQIDPHEDGDEWAKFRLLVANYRVAASALKTESTT